jgi:hypothetical protein
VEIAGRERTCGWISPGDLWAAPDGKAHILWTERALDERLREKFFPGERQSYSLNYAVVRGECSRALLTAEEGKSNGNPAKADFTSPRQHLFVFFYVSGEDGHGRPFPRPRTEIRVTDRSAIRSGAAGGYSLHDRYPGRITPSRLWAAWHTPGSGTTVSFAESKSMISGRHRVIGKGSTMNAQIVGKNTTRYEDGRLHFPCTRHGASAARGIIQAEHPLNDG